MIYLYDLGKMMESKLEAVISELKVEIRRSQKDTIDTSIQDIIFTRSEYSE